MTYSAVISRYVSHTVKKAVSLHCEWVHSCPTQTRTSSAPLCAHLMCLTGFRFDILNAVWVSVYTYSSYWLFVACFSMDTVYSSSSVMICFCSVQPLKFHLLSDQICAPETFERGRPLLKTLSKMFTPYSCHIFYSVGQQYQCYNFLINYPK